MLTNAHPGAAVSASSPSSLDSSDLQSLLAESIAQAVEVFSLEDLLSESMAEAKERVDTKLLRQRVASGGMGKQETIDANSILRIWEARREWVKTHNTITFTRCFCEQCGSYYPQFQSYGEQQNHKTTTATRWIKVPSHTSPELPRIVLYEDSYVPTCEVCAAASGWKVADEDSIVVEPLPESPQWPAQN